MSINGLAQRLMVPVSEAERLRDIYFQAYPRVKPFIDDNIEYAKRTGYARTIYGDKISVTPGAENRQGINYVIQNSASVSMISIFFNAIRHSWEDYHLPVRLVGNIHDSLQVSYPVKYIFIMKEIFQKFSREKGFHDLGVDFKYDFELCRKLAAIYHFEYSISSL